MAALEADLTVEAAADQVAIHGRSRYPAYTESLDEIIGVVHAKDILAALRSRPGQTDPHHHAAAAVRAGHARSGGRAGRHEAAQDPPGHRARRVRRHRRTGDHGGPAGGDRGADLRRARSRRTGPAPTMAAPRLDGSMPISEFNIAVRGRAGRHRLHHHRRLHLRPARPAAPGGRPGDRGAVHLRSRRDGWAAGEDGPAA